MVSKYRGSEEEEWQVEGLFGLHRLKPGMPKDPFPMLKIDQLVDATYGHPRMSFLDAFQGYHQIALPPEDREKTAFISPNANYHYNVMPFGLKNAGATYQRMMTKMFRDKIGCTVEVYIDDMVVKSKQEARHVEDLRGVFEVLQQHKLHLNAEKCIFDVRAGKFLGFLITNRGIKANLDQIEAMNRLRPPSNPKEVQVLTGMLAALNRFISKFVDRYRPFYQLLRKWKGFQWDEDCDKAFRDLKEYLTQAPILMAPDSGEDLVMYLSVSDHVIEGSFEARDSRMKAYLSAAKQINDKFGMVKVAQVGRAQNRHADSLATLASSMAEDVPRLIKLELIREPSIGITDNCITARVDVARISTTRSCWMDPIIDFLAEDRVPDDEKEAKKIRRVASRYWLSADRKLYRRSFRGPYLSCLHPEKVNELLSELHDRPVGHLNPVNSPWPFAQWGLDILGPFPRATGNLRFVLVAVDYFMKWAEAEALANIRDVDVKKFVWKNIVTRFEVPDSLISDNGLQFDNKAFRAVCSDLDIKNRYSTLTYPQRNGQAEATSKTILNGLKRRLDEAKGRWIEELPNVLRAYRTTPKRSIGETPFSLTYGAEAMMPAEVNLCSA
ncbi:uncharacterized protein LOC126700853 [Quercus robur]|uniref:uncharacterized protein LOC126700853 n=1 Tax=Quercus robur TaxID=38942 RepID=UPI002161BEB6|nr:uncharacterized protein LOC126700853 [Quercus robur]